MRTEGETWVLFFRTTRKSDGKRVENKVPIGLVQELPDKSSAPAQVDRLHLQLNQVDLRGKVTFSDLAHHYAEHELVEHTESVHPKAYTTMKGTSEYYAIGCYRDGETGLHWESNLWRLRNGSQR
jgi:hypothetical protein